VLRACLFAFSALLSHYSLPPVHPSSLLLAGGSKHHRRWFKPSPSPGAKPMLSTPLLRPLGPWVSHSAPNLEYLFVPPFRLSSSSLVSICRVFTPIFQTRIPLLHLESWFYTDSLPSFFPAQNTTQFFVLTLFASKWLAHRQVGSHLHNLRHDSRNNPCLHHVAQASTEKPLVIAKQNPAPAAWRALLPAAGHSIGWSS
jgi:hypothetical protein